MGDGFRLVGGTLNVRYLSAIFNAAAGIAVENGYAGKGQYLFRFHLKHERLIKPIGHRHPRPLRVSPPLERHTSATTFTTFTTITSDAPSKSAATTVASTIIAAATSAAVEMDSALRFGVLRDHGRRRWWRRQ